MFVVGKLYFKFFSKAFIYFLDFLSITDLNLVRIQVQKLGTREGCSSIPIEALKAEAKKFTTERP